VICLSVVSSASAEEQYTVQMLKKTKEKRLSILANCGSALAKNTAILGFARSLITRYCRHRADVRPPAKGLMLA
jgi:hypothetical protein